MASNVTRDHHNLRRNLKLNGNYISNDGGDEGIRITDAGLVGIGATPDSPLHVTATAQPVLHLEANVVDFMHFNRTAHGGVSTVYKISVGASDVMGIGRDGQEDLFILSSGNIGINDDAPAEKLDVDGNINVTGVYKVDDTEVISGTALASAVKLNNANWSGTDLSIANGGTGASDSNAWLNSRITTNADGSLNYDATGATAVNHDSLTGFDADEHIDWTASSAGTIHASNYTDTTTNTQNEYATSWVDSSNDVLLRLTESGAGSGTQDIKLVAGTGISLTPSGTDMTIANTVSAVTNHVTNDADDTMAGTLTIDKNTTSTSNGLVIDYDNTSDGSSDQTMAGLDVDAYSVLTTGGVQTLYGAKIHSQLQAASTGAGGMYGYGLYAQIVGTGNGLVDQATAAYLEVTGTADTNTGLYINCVNGGDDITIVSSLSANDWFKIQVGALGATTFTTQDSGGSDYEADLTLNIDGKVDINSGGTEDIILDSGGDITLDAGGGDVTVLQADLTIPIDKKVIFGNTGEYIVGDDTDLDIVSSNDLTLDAASTIVLDSADGTFVMKGAGTASEFSVANSAYAGMIIGYTTVGIDAADDSKTLGTSFGVVDADHNVSFIAPPSGVVEIFVSIFEDSGAGSKPMTFGLSDNATYNTLDVTHEHEVWTADRGEELMIDHRWVITGLTAGDTYKWWLGAKSSHIFTHILRWGGDATGEYAPFIMKATALPAAVTDFAVYG